MSDRPKKKMDRGGRNPDRPNGKAPKKHPKRNKVAELTDEQRAERDMARVKRADAKRIQKAVRQEAFINRKHSEALVMHRAWLAEQRRAVARTAIARMMPAVTCAGMFPDDQQHPGEDSPGNIEK